LGSQLISIGLNIIGKGNGRPLLFLKVSMAFETESEVLCAETGMVRTENNNARLGTKMVRMVARIDLIIVFPINLLSACEIILDAVQLNPLPRAKTLGSSYKRDKNEF